MSKVLFFKMPSSGHVNPTLGLVDALVKQGEEVIYFCSADYRERIEKSGAIFKNYDDKSILLENKHNVSGIVNIDDKLNYINEGLSSSEEIIQYILNQIKDIKFDYIIQSSMFPFGNIISQILKIPSINSFAIFAPSKDIIKDQDQLKNHPAIDNYKKISNKISRLYNIKMPTNMMDLFFSKGDLNIVYTSKYFISHIENYDDSFIFIGPSIYDSILFQLNN